MAISFLRGASPDFAVYQVCPRSRLSMPARRMLQGVLKSGSPTPSEITSSISAAMSKKRRMPEGFSATARRDKILS